MFHVYTAYSTARRINKKDNTILSFNLQVTRDDSLFTIWNKEIFCDFKSVVRRFYPL